MDIFDKLDSEEALKPVVIHLYGGFESIRRTIGNNLGLSGDGKEIAWWMVREHLRMKDPVRREVTPQLSELNAFNKGLFAHISTEDRTMVAYTPEASAGMADRQVRASIGKLYGRYMPFLSEAAVRSRVESHLAEVNDEKLFLEGDDIVNAYTKGLGSSSCMTGKDFGLGKEYFPSSIYKAPGIRMAFTRDGNGKPNSRAMVYENGDDKRYIRCYGDPRLKKRLEKAGYKVGGWNGVKFNATFITNKTPSDEGEDLRVLVMPYLDSFGAAASTTGSTVALIDDQLVGLEVEQAERIRAIDPNDKFALKVASSTAGFIELRNIKSDAYMVEDYFTKTQFSMLLEKSITILDMEGVHRAREQSFIASTLDTEWINGSRLPDSDDAKADTGKMRKADGFFDHNTSIFWLDREKERRKLGYDKLDAEMYPEMQGWTKHFRRIHHKNGMKNVRAEDAVLTIARRTVGEESIDLFTYRHKDEVQKNWVKLHHNKNHGSDCYIEPGSGAQVQKTVSGRKVHPLYNQDVVKSWKGLDFARNATEQFTTYGQTFFFSRADAITPEFITWREAKIAQTRQEWAEDLMKDIQKVAQQMFRLSGYQGRLIPSEGNQHFITSASRYTIEDRETFGYYKELIDDLLKAPRRDGYDPIDEYLVLRKVYLNTFAAAEAVDYNVVATPAPASNIVILPPVEEAATA